MAACTWSREASDVRGRHGSHWQAEVEVQRLEVSAGRAVDGWDDEVADDVQPALDDGSRVRKGSLWAPERVPHMHVTIHGDQAYERPSLFGLTVRCSWLVS